MGDLARKTLVRDELDDDSPYRTQPQMDFIVIWYFATYFITALNSGSQHLESVSTELRKYEEHMDIYIYLLKCSWLSLHFLKHNPLDPKLSFFCPFSGYLLSILGSDLSCSKLSRGSDGDMELEVAIRTSTIHGRPCLDQDLGCVSSEPTSEIQEQISKT